jgi:hypothetical protein
VDVCAEPSVNVLTEFTERHRPVLCRLLFALVPPDLRVIDELICVSLSDLFHNVCRMKVGESGNHGKPEAGTLLGLSTCKKV